MFSDFLRFRTVLNLSHVNVNLKKPEKLSLFLLLRTEIDVIVLDNKHIDKDFYEIAVGYITQGNLIGALNYLETFIGTEQVSTLYKKFRKIISEY